MLTECRELAVFIYLTLFTFVNKLLIEFFLEKRRAVENLWKSLWKLDGQDAQFPGLRISVAKMVLECGSLLPLCPGSSTPCG